jgi:hypothetical protein
LPLDTEFSVPILWPSTRADYEHIAAGMLVLAGEGRGFPVDYDELWTRVGFERRTRSRNGERSMAPERAAASSTSPVEVRHVQLLVAIMKCDGAFKVFQIDNAREGV